MEEATTRDKIQTNLKNKLSSRSKFSVKKSNFRNGTAMATKYPGTRLDKYSFEGKFDEKQKRCNSLKSTRNS